jgi:hypothetical protein
MRASTSSPNLTERLAPRFSINASGLWIPKQKIDVLTPRQVTSWLQLSAEPRNSCFDQANTSLSAFIIDTAIESGAFDEEFQRVSTAEIEQVVLATCVCTLDAKHHAFLIQTDGQHLRQEPVMSACDFLKALRDRKPHSYSSFLYCQTCQRKGNPTMTIAVWTQTAGKTGSLEQLPFGNNHDQTRTENRLMALAGINKLRTLRPSNVGGLKLSIDDLERRNTAVVAGSFLGIPQKLLCNISSIFKYPIEEVSLKNSSSTSLIPANWQLFTTTDRQKIYLRFSDDSKLIDVNQSRISQILTTSKQGFEVWKLAEFGLKSPQAVSLTFLKNMRDWAGKTNTEPQNPSIDWNLFVPVVLFETRYQISPMSYNLQLVTRFLQNMQSSVAQFDVNLYLTLMPSNVVDPIKRLLSRHVSALILVRKIDCVSICVIISSNFFYIMVS